MCWELDYLFFVEQQKAQQARIKDEQRPGVIGNLLAEAQKQAEHTSGDETPAKEAVPG